MPAQQLANYVQTTLAVACTNIATTLTLTSVAGLPTVGVFRLRIDDPAPATTFEYVEVASVNVGANQVTLTNRSTLEGTTPIAHNAGAFVSNKLTAAMLGQAFPGGTLGFISVTANQTGITTEVDLTSLTLSISLPTTFGSRRLRISWGLMILSTVSADVVALQCKAGAVVIGQSWQIIGAASQNQSMSGACITTQGGGGGSVVYKITLQRNVGTGTVTMNAAATSPAFLLVEDIGI